jgi:hypothetical protein
VLTQVQPGDHESEPLDTAGGSSTSVDNLGLMGEMREVFAAQDDETAISLLEARWGPPVYRACDV